MTNDEIKKSIQEMIDHLDKSFNDAQKYVDEKKLKHAFAEFAIGNKEIIQKLKQLIEKIND